MSRKFILKNQIRNITQKSPPCFVHNDEQKSDGRHFCLPPFFDLKLFYLAFFMVRTAPQETAMRAIAIATALSPVGAGEGATGAVFV